MTHITPHPAVPLRVYLLGAFRIEREGQTIRLPTHKEESLFAFLILHSEPHPREKLAALFWGDSTDEQARTSLRTALAALRKELGDEVLIADREMVALNPAFPIRVDAREIQRLENRESISNSQSPISLYSADLLPDFYDDWIAPERERLRKIYLDTLLRLAHQTRSESKYARAIELAQKVLAHDSANEKAHQQLIFCYAAAGNRASALEQYDKCKHMLQTEFGVEPSRETTALYQKILTEEIGNKSKDALLSNLPIPLTSFIGRQTEIEQVKQLVETTRLLTLTGAGGCGKSRLAIQVATELATKDRFKHGVWWVALAALNDPALVPQSVAMVFNLGETQGTALLTALTNYLRAKELLLIVDNCEHLLGACAQLIGTLLSACPQLRIMATSREVLNISGEAAWRVPSLTSPPLETLPPLDQLRRYDAIQLFAERALAVAMNWRLVENVMPTAQVCARLDGIPLAIELAAARLKVLSTREIAVRLDDRFNLLTGGSRTELPRHQTLRATMDWSFDLLSDAERVLLRRLSVFAGGWTLEAAEAVVRGQVSEVDQLISDDSPLTPVLDLLTSLIDKSLVVVGARDNTTRYRLLETVRQYAREKLIQANEAEEYFKRHRDWFLEIAEQADPHIRSRDQLEWCERLEREMENFRAALAWSLEQPNHTGVESALRLAGALWWFWMLRGYWNEARTWFERSLQNRVRTPLRAMPCLGLAVMEYYVGNSEKCAQLFEEAYALYKQQGDKRGSAFAASLLGSAGNDEARSNTLFDEARAVAQESNDEWLAARTDIGQGMFYAIHGNSARACPFFESALVHARIAGDRWFIRNSLDFLGSVAFALGQNERAATLFAESLEVSRELGNKNGIAQHLNNLGKVALRQDCRQARAYFEQAMALRREMGNPRGVLDCLWSFGKLAAAEQQFERAARLFGAAATLCEMLNENDRRPYLAEASALCEQMGNPAFDKARAEGRAMAVEQAIDYALEKSL